MARHGTPCLREREKKGSPFISFQSFGLRSPKKRKGKIMERVRGWVRGCVRGWVGAFVESGIRKEASNPPACCVGICSFGVGMPFSAKCLQTKARILRHQQTPFPSSLHINAQKAKERGNSNVGMFVFVIHYCSIKPNPYAHILFFFSILFSF